MPEMMTIPRRHAYGLDYATPITVPVATEAELLEFANTVRAAGAGDALEALIPSRPSAHNACLIANALNFKCLVDSGSLHEDRDGSLEWFMYLGERSELAKKIADAIGSKAVKINIGGGYRIKLPKHIGNAAHAFDAGVAFQNLIKEN